MNVKFKLLRQSKVIQAKVGTDNNLSYRLSMNMLLLGINSHSIINLIETDQRMEVIARNHLLNVQDQTIHR